MKMRGFWGTDLIKGLKRWIESSLVAQRCESLPPRPGNPAPPNLENEHLEPAGWKWLTL